MKTKSEIISLEGETFFRLRIAFSMLTKQPIKISKIRQDSVNPGISQSERTFLELVNTISNGTEIDLNSTGTTLRFTPGIITNNSGRSFSFHCNFGRSMVYFLEGIIPIAMFGKESLKMTLFGLTDDNKDIGIDRFNYSTMSLLQKLVVGDEFYARMKRRGLPEKGEGEVEVKVPIIMGINPIDWTKKGQLKKIRGTAFTSWVNRLFSSRMSRTAKDSLQELTTNVKIYEDNYKSKDETKMFDSKQIQGFWAKYDGGE